MLCLVPAGWSDIQAPTTAKGGGAKEQRREQPAHGVDQEIAVDQGGSVELTLRARGQIGKWIDFAIRTQPEHGSVGELRQVNRDSATITYTHRAADGPGTDSFAFVVHAPGSEVSAPATVNVTIRDTPPAIVANPAELDFGAVKVGDTSGADLTLQNSGGGEAIGRLDLPRPWVVEGSADYRLARGQQQTFHVLFAPQTGRSFSETLPLPSLAGPPTHLLGTGLGRPGEAELAASTGFVSGLNASSPAAGAGISAARAAGAGTKAEIAAFSRSERPGDSSTANPAASEPQQVIQIPDDTAAAAAGNPFVHLDTSGYSTLYDSGIKHLQFRGATRTTLDISWQGLNPAPKNYRIELRYLTIDGEKLGIDWRPYGQVTIQASTGLCTATIRGITPGTRQTVRVVAVDFSGRLLAGSATIQANTLPPSTFWQITPLKTLFGLLLLCGALVVRRRWEERQLLRAMAESRAATVNALSRS